MLTFDVKGVLPRQHIRDILIERHKAIRFQRPPSDEQLQEQLQPATLDTRLLGPIHRVADFRPPSKNESVAQVLEHCSLYTIDISASEPQPIERNVSYVVELNEFFSLPPNIFAEADTRSSGGRHFLRCRLVTDGTPRYNKIPVGYEGKLCMEFTSLAFLEILRAGDRVMQIRFYNGDARISDEELMDIHLRETIAYDKEGRPLSPTRDLINNGLVLTADLSDEVVGYVPTFNDGPVEYGTKESAPQEKYWRKLLKPGDGVLRLWENEMAILPTFEMPSIPHEICARMVQYDMTLSGDDKTNEAGFFDGSFGKGRNREVRGSTAVLEYVVSRKPRTITHRQPVATLVPERVIEVPERLYGDGTSSYQGQRGARLATTFY